jgi:hypothetical protein
VSQHGVENHDPNWRETSCASRVRRLYFDAIVAGTKTHEIRAKTAHWDKVVARYPILFTFVCGKRVHTRQIVEITWWDDAAEALGREPSEQGREDLGYGPVYDFRLGAALPEQSEDGR